MPESVQKQKEREVLAAQPGEERGELEEGERNPQIAFENSVDFGKSDLMVLHSLYFNGPSYSAKLAKELKTSTVNLCYIIKKLDKKGLIKVARMEKDCMLCGGTGNRSLGGSLRICVNCNGKGRLITKTYPVFIEINESAKPLCVSLFSASRMMNILKANMK